MERLPALSWLGLATGWTVAPALTAVLLLAAAAYLVGLARFHRSGGGRSWPRRRTAAFLAGLVLIAVTVQGGIGSYGHALFWIHMIQHLLLIMVVPVLLAAGAPLRLLLTASRRPDRVQRALTSRPVAALTHPLVGLATYTVIIVGTHLSGFMDLMPTHPWTPGVEIAAYVLGGYLYFLPLIGSEPIRWRLSYPAKALVLGLAMPVDTFVGLALTLDGHDPFPGYMAMRPAWAPDPLLDLHTGGAIMWVGGDGLMMILIAVLFRIWAHRDNPAGGAGGWLEAVRRATLEKHTGLISVDGAGATVDEDETALAAYNAWLTRLDHQPPR